MATITSYWQSSLGLTAGILLLSCLSWHPLGFTQQVVNPPPVAATATTAPVKTADDTSPAKTDAAAVQDSVSSMGLSELPPVSASNQIPLLNNRFRIDEAVAEITLVLFRKKGTPSVVLVKPDGSKIYARTAKEHGIEWHDDTTYDLIKMTQPTPGPWQAVGEVLSDSRIMVLTDIDLVVDALPTDMMVGESLKVTARLTNDGQLINARDFRDVLQLDVLLISTQKEQYDNFNQTVLEFTSFKDDGKNFDERARDAIFTGEFKLDMPAGEWMPKYIVKTPLYTRELSQNPLVIQRTPVTTEMVESFVEAEKHQLTYQVDPEKVNGDSVSLQGRIRFPNGEVQSFTMGEQPGSTRTLGIANAGLGTYRVETTLFGTTVAGREFVLTLPEITFAAVGEKVEVPAIADVAAPDGTAASVGEDTAADPNVLAVPVIAAEPEPEPAPFPWGLVIGVNLFIVIVGGAVIFFLMNEQAKTMLTMLLAKANPKLLLKRQQAQIGAESASGGATPDSQKAQKSGKRDEILDLSLPDD